MRRSNAEAAETRQRILTTASRLFRKEGIHGIGVAELMRRAGLTHGGFYKHFSSKDALVAEACALGLAETGESLAAAARGALPGEGLRRILENYLSTEHRDHPERGCTIAALGGEVAHGDDAARAVLDRGVDDLVAIVAGQLDDDDPNGRCSRARAIVATMVGGLVTARTTTDPELSDRILYDTKRFILEYAGREAPR